jgi:hypothetical protein
MTGASFNYVASLYEAALDSGLDVQAIRLRLAEHGIRRTTVQVVYDLDTVFEFVGYAASHPAPPAQAKAELDKAMDAMTEREISAFNRAWDAGIRTAVL